MGKCEISRKGRSPRELNFLRQLQICAFPQHGEGPREVVSQESPLPRRLQCGRARGSGRAPPTPPLAPRWGNLAVRGICLPAKHPGMPMARLIGV